MSQRTDSSYHENLMFLQGAYPDWTPDDLGSVLTDCNNDVSLAVTRISSGRAYHWGSVSRKKDKKPTPNSSTKDTASARGESRAGRGGRGGRGGPGRGGAATRGRGGPSRVGHVNGRSHTASPRHASAIDSSASVVVSSAHSESADIPKPAAEANGDQNNATDPWTDHKTAQPEVAITSAPPKSVQYDAPTPAAPLVNLPPSHKQVSKAVKLSWAQIASKQTPKPTPLLPVQSPASAPLEQTSTPAPAPPEESEPVPEPAGWEEPTTVQHPSWESDPSHSSPAVDLPSEESKLEPSAPSLMPEKSQVPSRSPTPAQEPAQEPTPAKVEPLSQSVAPSLPDPPSTSATIIPPSLKSAPRTTVPSSRAGVRNKLIDQPVVMPSSFGSVEKVGMQFGSLSLDGESLFESTSTSTELETPAISATAPEAVAAPTTPGKPQYEASSSTAPPAPPVPPVLAPAASASLGSIPQPQQQVAQMSPVAQHQPHPSAAGAQSNSQQPLPTSVSQPPQSTQTPVRTSAAAASPLQQYTHQPQIQAQQPSLTALQQQPQQPQQNHHQLPQHHNLPQQVQQSHTHHQYSQHFPAQLESQQQHLPSVAQHQQPQNAAAQSNYFRQNDTSNNAPYFHTPTPSTGQAQDYSAFNQLGQQSQHQQASHLGGFGSVDYGYDNQRGFYDSYPQQTGFNNNRGVLSGHDEIKDLPGSQQPPANSLPPSTTRTSQQNANQPQSVGGQGPQQQFPPPPVPYYYPYQNQYYSVPYTTAYNTQPYPVKYPAMFQHGPPGANSVPNSAGKQPGQNVSGVQPQNNPYSASLYQQGYDDYSQPHHLPQNLGLSQSGLGHVNEFGKFYGSGQGFVGLGAQSGGTASGVVTGAGGASGPRNAGSSPETQFKYQKDNGIGVGGGRGAGTGSVQGGTGTGGPGQGGVQPTQGQGQGGAQAGPQGQGYYGSANRFGSGSAGAAAATGGIGATGVGIGGPQQNVQLHHPHHQQGGPQGHHPGYLQNTNDGILWYQGQQSYWR